MLCIYVVWVVSVSSSFWILQLLCCAHDFPDTSILCCLICSTLHHPPQCITIYYHTSFLYAHYTTMHIERQNEENICRWYNFRDVWFLTPHKKENEICTTLVFQISITKRQQTHCDKQHESCEMYVYIKMEIFWTISFVPNNLVITETSVNRAALIPMFVHWNKNTFIGSYIRKVSEKLAFMVIITGGYLLSPYREFLGLSSLLGLFQDGMNHRLQYQFREKLLLVVVGSIWRILRMFLAAHGKQVNFCRQHKASQQPYSGCFVLKAGQSVLSWSVLVVSVCRLWGHTEALIALLSWGTLTIHNTLVISRPYILSIRSLSLRALGRSTLLPRTNTCKHTHNNNNQCTAGECMSL